MEKYFDQLEELIKDDDKIITVPLYAAIANLPYEKAKECITKFIEINQGSQEIHPTYVLNGVQKDNGKTSVVLISGESHINEKQMFESNVKKSVFSIQKAKDVNYNMISLVQPDIESQLDVVKLGALVGKNCIKRAIKKRIVSSTCGPLLKEKSTAFSNSSKTISEEIKTEKKNEHNKEEINKPKTNTQSSIANLFNNAAQNKKKPKLTDPKPVSNNGLSNFLTKSSSKNSSDSIENNEIKIKEEECVSKKEEKELDLFDIDTDEDILKDLDIPANKSEPSKVEKSMKSSQKKKTKQSKTVKQSKTEKKRKRIIIDEGSDSDDIFGSDKSDAEDDLIEQTLVEEQEPSSKLLPPKNKRRKAVKNTYEDDEGFIVTQTEYIFETASEDENEPNNKIAKHEELVKPKMQKKGSISLENNTSPNKAAATAKKGGKNKAQKTNQPTLMNFFKKK
ncbi:DNA polymerase delta subunit 3-like [Euwallacea fornicatus]|uniref:DNA polymerase delta subunit 3-like n=1 Tax=Euwallacea fornicatus TaxID=995702 RepID=UPI00338DFEBA